MNVTHFFKLFVVSLPIFIILDVVWLGILMQDTYKQYLAPFVRLHNDKIQVDYFAGFAVWALIVVGAIIFVLPRTAGYGMIATFGFGALYGLVLYGVYDLTNFAIIKDWPLTITLVDIAWGMTVNGILLVLLKWVDSYWNN